LDCRDYINEKVMCQDDFMNQYGLLVLDFIMHLTDLWGIGFI
jgi:hypothetical protein